MSDRIETLRKEPAIMKLFMLFKKKYYSLGRVGGAVDVTSFSAKDIEAIAGLLGESPDHLQEKGKVSLLAFEKSLLKTVFADYSFTGLLEEVLQQTLLTKTAEEAKKQSAEDHFFRSLHLSLPEGSWWWEWIYSKQPDARWIWNLYKQNEAALLTKLSTVFHAFQKLPQSGSYERLPLFAQRTTGNPHFFDYNETTGKLFCHCLSVNQQLKGLGKAGLPKTTEELNELLSSYGLMRDDLWSFVTCRGFLAKEDQDIHPVWQEAVKADVVLNMPIKTLLNIKMAWPAKGNTAWIVENSSVCSAIMDAVPGAPVICTHGQVRTAGWMLLDLLVQSGCSLFYSGDMDPEGLTIAQRLKDRYKEQLTFWRMDEIDYLQALSEEDISARLAKVQSITSPELKKVADTMGIKRKASYQEGLMNKLIQDLKQDWR